MPRFNAAKSWKKLDDDLSGKFNYLCDLLDEGYSSVALINNHEIAIDINPKDGIKIVNDGSSIFSLDPLTGEIVIGKYDGLISDLETDLGTAYNDIAQQLGYTDYDDMVAEAIAGNTIINGGWLRTSLIQANTILFDQLASSTVTSITDTIDIGGRNLLRNTGSGFTTDDGWTGYGNHSTRIDSNFLVIDSTGAGDVSNNVASYANVASGQEYTLSFSVYSASAQTVHVELWGSVGATDIAVTAGWQRVSCSLTGSAQPYFYIWLAAAGSVALNEIMLEKGNKATDWTPAPEDKLSEGVSYAGVVINATNGFVNTATIGGKTATIKVNATDGLSFYDGATYRGGMKVRNGKLTLLTDILGTVSDDNHFVEFDEHNLYGSAAEQYSLLKFFASDNAASPAPVETFRMASRYWETTDTAQTFLGIGINETTVDAADVILSAGMSLETPIGSASLRLNSSPLSDSATINLLAINPSENSSGFQIYANASTPKIDVMVDYTNIGQWLATGLKINGNFVWHEGNANFAAGSGTVSSSWTSVSFGKTFASPPKVFACYAADFTGDSGILKVRNVTTTGFEWIIGGSFTSRNANWLAILI